MNAIAFSLYGDNPKYCIGALRNAELTPCIYPAWTMVVYADDTVPHNILNGLRDRGAVLKPPVGPNKMMWRFSINDEPGIERYLVRDVDSRLGEREKAAVERWLASGLPFHVMRDHPFHGVPILGGTWAAIGPECGGVIPSMLSLMKRWNSQSTRHGEDQEFLAAAVWPLVKDCCLQHDSCTRHRFPGSQPFPTPLPKHNLRFVGEQFEISPDGIEAPHVFEVDPGSWATEAED